MERACNILIDGFQFYRRELHLTTANHFGGREAAVWAAEIEAPAGRLDRIAGVTEYA